MNLELNAMLSGDFLQSKVKVSKTVLKTWLVSEEVKKIMHNTGMSVENYNANEFKFSPAEFIHIESVHNSSQLKAEIKVQQY